MDARAKHASVISRFEQPRLSRRNYFLVSFHGSLVTQASGRVGLSLYEHLALNLLADGALSEDDVNSGLASAAGEKISHTDRRGTNHWNAGRRFLAAGKRHQNRAFLDAFLA